MMADLSNNTTEQTNSPNNDSNNPACNKSSETIKDNSEVIKNEIAMETQNSEQAVPSEMNENTVKNGLKPEENQNESISKLQSEVTNKAENDAVSDLPQQLDADVASNLEDVKKWTEEMEKIDEGSPQKGAEFMSQHYNNDQLAEVSGEQRDQTTANEKEIIQTDNENASGVSNEQCEQGKDNTEKVNDVSNEQSVKPEEGMSQDSNEQVNEKDQSVHTEEGIDNTDNAKISGKNQNKDNDSSTTGEDKAMSLDQIQSMLNTINTDISLLKDNTNIGETEKTKAKADGDFHDLRMRNDQIRQELLSIKKNQEMRMTLQPAAVEHKIVESTKKNKLKDCTKSLEEEIEIINKARKAQASLKQRQEERRMAAIKKQRGEQTSDGKDVTVTELKTSIRLLKEEMQKISNFPISDIVPEDPSDNTQNENAEAVSDNAETAESASGNTAEEKPKSKNAKVQEEMLRKYLMMNVMRQNVQVLTEKMNEIMKSQGVEPVKPGETLQKSSVAAENKDNDDGENNDDYYVYDDEEEEHSDLYKEDDGEDGNVVDEVKGESDELQKKKESVMEAAAKSIAKVEALIYKDKDPEGSETSNLESTTDQPKVQLSKSQKKKLKKRQNAQSNVVNQNNKTTSNTATSNVEKKNEAPADDEPLMNPEKMRAYNLLLKLQREMASMQIQVTKLQDNMRAANAALKEVLESEFSNV